MSTKASTPPPAPAPAAIGLSVVVIGRNEGQRLLACLQSLEAADWCGLTIERIYVDSDSTDGSPEVAERMGAKVIRLRPERPCAAVGRNAGLAQAQGQWVLFLDGDTLLDPNFVRAALATLTQRPEGAVVWGHRRERHPEHSIYNRVLDLDWVYAPGDTDFCGGDALFRMSALKASGGFDDSLIAGEEPELCARLRALGWRIIHIDAPMTEHDLAITRWSAYWRRAERAGHAYAEVSHRLAHTATPLWQDDARRNRHRALVLLFGLGLILFSGLMAWWWLLGVLLLGASALVLRSAWRARWKSNHALTLLLYAVHVQLQQLPIAWGQLRWWWSHRQGQQRGLMDYKRGS
jgi:glycosyltransferase involved in cell wall biosynthesis